MIRVRLPYHEVGLDLHFPTDAEHGLRAIDEAKSLRFNVGVENACETSQHRLVIVGGWRCHPQISVDELVLVAVVREALEVLPRPVSGLGVHSHAGAFLGAVDRWAGMPEDGGRRDGRPHRSNAWPFIASQVVSPSVRSAARPSQAGVSPGGVTAGSVAPSSKRWLTRPTA